MYSVLAGRADSISTKVLVIFANFNTSSQLGLQYGASHMRIQGKYYVIWSLILIRQDGIDGGVGHHTRRNCRLGTHTYHKGILEAYICFRLSRLLQMLWGVGELLLIPNGTGT